MTLAEPAALYQEAICIGAPKLLTSRGSRWLQAKISIAHRTAKHRLEHRPARCNRSIAVIGLVEADAGQRINNHVAWSGIESSHSFGAGACRNRRKVGDTADILQNTSSSCISKQYVIKQRHKRGALTTGQH